MQRTATAGLATCVVVLAVGALYGGLGGGADGAPAADVDLGWRVLLVSGRDDHGLLEHEEVDLLAAPAPEGEGRVVGTVPDGTLVRVFGDDGGSWLEVVTLDGDAAGWVDDHRLRGTAHVVAEEPACPSPLRADAEGRVVAELRASEQVELVDDHTTVDGTRWVGVRTLQGGDLGLVPAERLAQLPGPPTPSGQPCATVDPDPEAAPHRH